MTKQDESHTINATINYTLDSLTDVLIQSKFKSDKNSQDDLASNTFLTANDLTSRITNSNNYNTGNIMNSDNLIKITRSFKKKERKLIATYNFKTSDIKTAGFLKWDDHNFLNRSEEHTSELQS